MELFLDNELSDDNFERHYRQYANYTNLEEISDLDDNLSGSDDINISDEQYKLIKYKIKLFIDIEYSHDILKKEFIIQYGVLRLSNYKYNKLKGYLCYVINGTYYSCMYIHDINKIKESTDTNIVLYTIHKYEPYYRIIDLIDKRGLSSHNNIYIIDLYPNYTPKHFHCICEYEGFPNENDYHTFKLSNVTQYSNKVKHLV